MAGAHARSRRAGGRRRLERAHRAGPNLVALKLFAGGAQDAWDVAQLLAGPDREALIAEVSADIGDLPAHCRKSWERILAGDSP